MRKTLSWPVLAAVLALAGSFLLGHDATHEPKRLWIAQGAAHVDLQTFTSAEYQRTVLGFLAEHLSAAGTLL
jgi:fermentation-respiration switch protein FrsA (DUF1100 family)